MQMELRSFHWFAQRRLSIDTGAFLVARLDFGGRILGLVGSISLAGLLSFQNRPRQACCRDVFNLNDPCGLLSKAGRAASDFGSAASDREPGIRAEKEIGPWQVGDLERLPLFGGR